MNHENQIINVNIDEFTILELMKSYQTDFNQD